MCIGAPGPGGMVCFVVFGTTVGPNIKPSQPQQEQKHAPIVFGQSWSGRQSHGSACATCNHKKARSVSSKTPLTTHTAHPSQNNIHSYSNLQTRAHVRDGRQAAGCGQVAAQNLWEAWESPAPSSTLSSSIQRRTLMLAEPST